MLVGAEIGLKGKLVLEISQVRGKSETFTRGLIIDDSFDGMVVSSRVRDQEMRAYR